MPNCYTCGSELNEWSESNSKPLDVVWQCKACHSAFHAIERRALNWLETKTPLSVKKRGRSHWQKRLLTKTSPQR